MLYKIDLNRLALQLLPSYYRQPIIFGLLRAALGRLNNVYNAFLKTRQRHIYRLTHNGQVCHLRAVLNDRFTSKYGKFDILTVEREGKWLFAVSESGVRIPITMSEEGARQFVTGSPLPVVFSEISLNSLQNSFVVSVPADLYQTNLSDIITLVDRYKLISKIAVYTAQS